MEAIAIADWLAGYKLQDYVASFEAQGYDNTDFLAGITQEVCMLLHVSLVAILVFVNCKCGTLSASCTFFSER